VDGCALADLEAPRPDVTRLYVAPEAEEELAASADWYESRRAGLGVELVATIDGALEEIMAAPLACPTWRADRPYRKKTVRRFPYVIFFDVRDDVVFVIAVAHAHRRPGYWVGRGESPA
jgi:plasmid stabilization system protein ParE